MKNKSLKKVFYSLIVIFVLLITYLFIPFNENIKRPLFPLFGFLGLLFFILGIVLIFLSKQKKKKLKFFLILTGFSSLGPLLFSILHNVFYALSITFQNFKIVFEILHVTSFLLATIITPTTFLIGIVGSIILLNTKSYKK